MKKVLLLIVSVFLISSCSNEFDGTKENIEATYKIENRSLNLENKNINFSLRLNHTMSGTEVNNIFLWQNKIQLIDVSWFEKLWTLEIDNNDIRFIWDLKLPLTIRHLNLSHNNLTSLKWIEKYTKLKTIDVSYNKLDSDSLKSLEWMKNLKYINVEWNSLSEKVLNKVNSFNSRYLLNNEIPFTD